MYVNCVSVRKPFLWGCSRTCVLSPATAQPPQQHTHTHTLSHTHTHSHTRTRTLTHKQNNVCITHYCTDILFCFHILVFCHWHIAYCTHAITISLLCVKTNRWSVSILKT